MNIKKTITALILAVAVITPSALAANFTDTRGHWAEGIINNLADRGIVSGVSDTEFNPDGIVTRAEFYRMALGVVNIEETQYREGECFEVKASDWYANTIQTALDKGLIPDAMISDFSVRVESDENSAKAVYGGSFNATTPITREEMAYVSQSVYQYSLGEGGLDKLEMPVDLDFDDTSKISIWAMDGVKHAYVNGLISGMGDGTFRPHETATRAQAASIITNLLNK